MFSSKQGTFAAPALISSRPWTSVRTEDALFLCSWLARGRDREGPRGFVLLTLSGCRVVVGSTRGLQSLH